MLAIMVSALGHISGGHFNPAVTFGFLVTRRICGSTAGIYWGFQFLGGILAALTIKALHDRTSRRQAEIDIGSGGAGARAVRLDARGVPRRDRDDVLPRARRVRDRRRQEGAFKMVAGFAIGLTIGVDILVAAPDLRCLHEPAGGARLRRRRRGRGTRAPGSTTSPARSGPHSPHCSTTGCSSARARGRPIPSRRARKRSLSR